MARPKVPEAPARHPARRILGEHTAQEIADALGLKVATIYAARKDLRLPLADRIVEAFKDAADPPPKSMARQAQERKAAQPATKPGPKPATANSKVCAVAADEFLRQVEGSQQMGDMEAMARTAVSNITKTELLPALKELLGKQKGSTPPAFLVIPISRETLKKLGVG